MSRCHVFNPEFCQPLWKAPYPYTRPGVSLLQIIQLGIKNAIKWQREEFTEDFFPMPNALEIDDDGWMDVDSLEELEEEMKALSSRQVSLISSKTAKSGMSRRKTRRSRVDKNFDSCNEDDDKSLQAKDDAETLNKILTGFRTFVDGDGDLDGVLTPNVKNSTYASESNSLVLDSQNNVPDELNIDPRKFLYTLHAMLRNNRDITKSKSKSFEDDDDISKFFLHEDLDDGNGNGSDESSDEASRLEYGSGQDEFMMPIIMVSLTINVLEVADSTLTSYNFFIQKEAMDHELRTGDASHQSIKNLSVASEKNSIGDDNFDKNILKNLLSSLEAEGEQGSGPVSNMLREMGICPPRLHVKELV